MLRPHGNIRITFLVLVWLGLLLLFLALSFPDGSCHGARSMTMSSSRRHQKRGRTLSSSSSRHYHQRHSRSRSRSRFSRRLHRPFHGGQVQRRQCFGKSQRQRRTSILQRSLSRRRRRLLRQQTTKKRLLLQPKRVWLQEHFPNPQQQQITNDGAAGASTAATNLCHAVKSDRICDPDQVLSPQGLQLVEDYLLVPKYAARTHHGGSVQDRCLVPPPTTEKEEVTPGGDGGETQREEEEEAQKGLEIQMGVALVQQMDLSPFADNLQDREERAAETFARYVHDSWGVGIETESCGGAGILLFLSIRDRTVYVSRGSALEGYLTDRRLDRVIENMKDALRAGQYDTAILQAFEDMLAYIDQGPPTLFENFIFYFTSIIFPLLWIGGIIGIVVKNVWADSRRRRDYARVSSQLNEIDQARAEALQGKYKARSCPICLEDFESPSSDDNDGVAKIGSDGQPIKLLRCGHCMDESCWAEWVSSGRGTVTKCPICQQDVGSNDSAATGRQEQQQRRHAAGGNNNQSTQERETDQNNDLRNEFVNQEDRLLRQYRRERNFRLARLGYRYPQFVRPAQIQRWTQATYEGSLVRDASFVQSNPSIVRPGSSSGSSSGFRSGGFGGSSSGGGRGGRW